MMPPREVSCGPLVVLSGTPAALFRSQKHTPEPEHTFDASVACHLVRTSNYGQNPDRVHSFGKVIVTIW